MTDNVTLEGTLDSDGAVIRSDDDGTAQWQYVKLAFGADGTRTIVGSISSNPFPVALSATDNAVLDDIAAQTSAVSVHVDDAAFTLGTDSGTMMMAFAGAQSVNANDAGALQMDTDGALHISDGGNTITVDGTVTANPASGTIDTVTAVTDITNTIDTTISGAALTALQLIDNPVAVLGTATYSEATTSGNVIGVVRNDLLATLASVDNEIAPLQVNAGGALYIADHGGANVQPSIDSYTSDDVNVAAAADSVLKTAPGANKQIWVYGLALTANVDGSFSIQDEDNVAHTGIMPIAANGGFVMNPSGNFAMPWFKVATDKALEIDTVTCTADGVITYAIVSV